MRDAEKLAAPRTVAGHDAVPDYHRPLLAPLTDSIRQLVDATVRTEVDDDELRRAHREIAAIAARLQARQMPGSYGQRVAAGSARFWGNPVVGVRNAIAPPLVIEYDDSGRVSAEFHLGAAYEGPSGLVHGGVSALLLDQILGDAAAAGGKPGMTGTLTLRYRRGTPLGALRAEAWIERVEGFKTFVAGHLLDADGPTVQAEGVFIVPRWARGEAGAGEWAQAMPDRFA